MKKTFFIILSCCLLFCVGCKKDDFVTNKYKASFEYHFNNPDNQATVNNLLKNYDGVWMSEIELTLLNTSTTDAEAHTKFEAAVAVIVLEAGSLKSFFEANDYMIYTLERTTSGNEKTLRQVKFYKDGDHLVNKDL